MDKNIKINISTDVLDSWVFSSCRYYIGRHSIHAYHAGCELAEFFKNNPGVFSKERLVFLANDIRHRINDVLHFAPNIYVDGFAEEHRPDALTLWIQKIEEIIRTENTFLDEDGTAGGFCPSKYKWHIDLYRSEVYYEDFTPAQDQFITKPSEYLSDLQIWIKVAGYLDPYLNIQAEDGTQIIDALGFYIPEIVRYQGEDHFRVEMNPCDQATFIKNPFRNSYINPKYCTKIETLK